jgi:hypothetical protein
MTAIEVTLLLAGALVVCAVWIVWLVVTVARMSRMCDDMAHRMHELSADVSMLRLDYDVRHSMRVDRRVRRE